MRIKRVTQLLFVVVQIAIISVGGYVLFGHSAPAKAATTITVNSTADTIADDGECTLREAINAANDDTESGSTPGECAAGSGTDTIAFNIGPLDSSTKTIALTATLPAITQPVTIDGYTQDDATPNTAVSPAPFNGTLRVVIDGDGIASPTDAGLSFRGSSTGSIVRGLVLNNFHGAGIYGTAINISTTSVSIKGNYIGINAAGTTAAGNDWAGVSNDNTGSAANAVIGGTAAADRNIFAANESSAMYPRDGWIIRGNYIGLAADGTTAVGNSSVSGAGAASIDNCDGVTVGGTAAGAANVISGNLSHGLAPDSATNLTIQGNLIGTDYTGTVAMGNGGTGITISGDASGTLVGGTTTAARNVIADSTLEGIFIGTTGTGVTVQGNYIGTDITGTQDLGNGDNGVSIASGTTKNILGGIAVGAGNTIAFNTNNGVTIGGSLSGTENQNAVLGNAIFSNGDLGIDLAGNGVTANDAGDGDAGPNGLLNAPVITSVTEGGGSTTIDYTLDVPTGSYRTEFFTNTAQDASGYGEGETLLGTQNVTSTGTSATHSVTLSGTGYTFLSATATERSVSTPSTFGSTSEFGGWTADLAVTKTDGTAYVLPGTAGTTYTVTVTNNGPSTITGFSMSDTPTNFTTTSVVISGGTATDPGAGVGDDWTGVLEAGQTLEFTIDGTIDDSSLGGTVVNQVSVGALLASDGSTVTDPVSGNNTSTDSDDITLTNDMSLTKTLTNPEDVGPGATLTYDVGLKNNGPDPVDLTAFNGAFSQPTNMLFLDFVPSNLTFVQTTTTDVACVDAGEAGTILGPLAANHSANHLVLCLYTGGSQTLASGDTFTTSLEFTADGDTTSDSSFTNYVINAYQHDPDFAAFGAAYFAGVDLIDNLDINNLASAVYPAPTPPPSGDGGGGTSGGSSGGILPAVGAAGRLGALLGFVGLATAAAAATYVTSRRRTRSSSDV